MTINLEKFAKDNGVNYNLSALTIILKQLY